MITRASLLLLWLLLLAVPLDAGQTAEFSFTGLDGTAYTSSRLKGTAVVINIGSHW